MCVRACARPHTHKKDLDFMTMANATFVNDSREEMGFILQKWKRVHLAGTLPFSSREAYTRKKDGGL